jgi:predicted amidohydrolase
MIETNDVIKIGLVQMFCEKADIAGNLQAHSCYIEDAESKGVDILAFPEASITGYQDRNLDKYPGVIIRPDGPEINAVSKMTEGRKMTVLAGFIEANPAGKPYVTQAVILHGLVIGYYRKRTVVDEDNEWFLPGETAGVFDHNGLKFGMAICSDIANEKVFADSARNGARIVFELAAPGLLGEQATRDWQAGFEWWQGSCRKHLPGYAGKYGIWIAVATQADRTVNEDFPGGGYLFSPESPCLYASPDWSPGTVYLAIDLNTNQVTEI